MYTFFGAATQLRSPRSLYTSKNRNLNSITYPPQKIDGNRNFFHTFLVFFDIGFTYSVSSRIGCALPPSIHTMFVASHRINRRSCMASTSVPYRCVSSISNDSSVYNVYMTEQSKHIVLALLLISIVHWHMICQVIPVQMNTLLRQLQVQS